MEVHGNTHQAVESIAIDSRKAQRNGVFVAIPGTITDGHQYMGSAIDKGVVAVVCEHMPEELHPGVTYIQVTDSAAAAGIMAANFYDNPAEKLQLIGVTGTNGKTSVVSLAHGMFRQLGYKVGMLSTVEIRVNEMVHPATHTTPDPVQINYWLNEMVQAGCEYAVMEVSSHAVHQQRIAGLHFAMGVFTNITRDHLDYHGTFQEYIRAKKAFFDGLPSDAIALVNADDPNGKVMLQNTRARKAGFGVRTPADVKAKVVENSFHGLHLMVDGQDVYTGLIGRFNAYNLTAVYAIGKLMEQDPLQVLTSLSVLKPPAGRFQFFRSDDGLTIIVDYAHTPDALENVLTTIQDIRTGNEKVITLIGCGGDRDKGKRPEMARIACKYSDRVIFTSDNPRSEDPYQIIEDMKAGVPPEHFNRYMTNPNRADAIKQACMDGEPGDIILIAGKGHETYQEIQGVRHDFDDMKIARETTKQLKK